MKLIFNVFRALLPGCPSRGLSGFFTFKFTF
jgi:hypothetical protein